MRSAKWLCLPTHLKVSTWSPVTIVCTACAQRALCVSWPHLLRIWSKINWLRDHLSLLILLKWKEIILIIKHRMYLFPFLSTYSSMSVQPCPTFMQFSALSFNVITMLYMYTCRQTTSGHQQPVLWWMVVRYPQFVCLPCVCRCHDWGRAMQCVWFLLCSWMFWRR